MFQGKLGFFCEIANYKLCNCSFQFKGINYMKIIIFLIPIKIKNMVNHFGNNVFKYSFWYKLSPLTQVSSSKASTFLLVKKASCIVGMKALSLDNLLQKWLQIAPKRKICIKTHAKSSKLVPYMIVVVIRALDFNWNL